MTEECIAALTVGIPPGPGLSRLCPLCKSTVDTWRARCPCGSLSLPVWGGVMPTPYGEPPCSCPESAWLRGLLRAILEADGPDRLRKAVLSAGEALRAAEEAEEGVYDG